MVELSEFKGGERLKRRYIAVLLIVVLLSNYHSTRSHIHALDGAHSDKQYAILEAGKTGSCPTEEMPWQNDPRFLQFAEQNDTPILMAGYKSVLKDPLPGEEENVHLAADMLCGTIVKPGEIFSQNGKIGPYTEARGFQKRPTYLGSILSTTIGGGVCKIASTLYNVAILSNMKIIERHHHAMPVPYVPYGQDATVYYGGKDFKFKNNNDFPIMVWSKGIDNVLYIGFYGKAKPPKVEWHHEILGHQRASILYKKNPKLAPGEEKVIIEPMDGYTVKSWVTMEEEGKITVKELGVSYYGPLTGLVERN